MDGILETDGMGDPRGDSFLMSRLPQEIAGLIRGFLTTIVPSDDDGWS